MGARDVSLQEFAGEMTGAVFADEWKVPKYAEKVLCFAFLVSATRNHWRVGFLVRFAIVAEMLSVWARRRAQVVRFNAAAFARFINIQMGEEIKKGEALKVESPPFAQIPFGTVASAFCSLSGWL
jgi:hypothetical protein